MGFFCILRKIIGGNHKLVIKRIVEVLLDMKTRRSLSYLYGHEKGGICNIAKVR
jgi:uncharacterized protein YjaZ